MARTQLTAVTPDRDGVVSTTESADAANGNSVPWTGREVFIIDNGDTASHTASISIADTVDGEPVDPKEVAIPAGETRVAGTYPDVYRQDADGMVYIDWDADTSVTVRTLRVP